ncbi:hypothetical protein [Natronobacterium texcoconense]|uniref:Uncharacterized protein n=1 Tax=Natronobacterium texcoconense TaxID=1095778 RepID=A0A1H1FU53_NATTX|nr:hypothetical protein [Natronobacterium texcoconense]SDR04464.1 hypothetical protein SAMN04489842_2117 [Natronobacterium texcoconense]
MAETRTAETGTSIGETVLDSLSLKLAVTGLAMTAVGFVVHDGVIPAFMVIWGLALLVIGSVSYAAIAYRAS